MNITDILCNKIKVKLINYIWNSGIESYEIFMHGTVKILIIDRDVGNIINPMFIAIDLGIGRSYSLNQCEDAWKNL